MNIYVENEIALKWNGITYLFWAFKTDNDQMNPGDNPDSSLKTILETSAISD